MSYRLSRRVVACAFVGVFAALQCAVSAGASDEQAVGRVGIRFGMRDGPFAESVEPASPAARAGLKAGDRIVKIDGESCAGMTLEDVVKRVRGRVGAKVVLAVLRRGTAQPQEYTVIREAIVDPVSQFSDSGQDKFNHSDFQGALADWKQGLELAGAREDKQALGVFLGNIGMVYDGLGDYPKALDYFSRALRIFREIGVPTNISEGHIGDVHLAQKDFQADSKTGMGRQICGEGVMGLGRAFQYAGAKNVLVSLWSVAEQSTTLLTESFFKHLREGKPPREALKLARAEIRAKGYEHPFFWAPFVLMGG